MKAWKLFLKILFSKLLQLSLIKFRWIKFYTPSTPFIIEANFMGNSKKNYCVISMGIFTNYVGNISILSTTFAAEVREQIWQEILCLNLNLRPKLFNPCPIPFPSPLLYERFLWFDFISILDLQIRDANTAYEFNK